MVGPVRDCSAWLGHRWKSVHNLNSGFYHHGALTRAGHLCTHCYAVKFPQSDAEYYDALPKWMKDDPDLRLPNAEIRHANPKN
jgi:hypothetical protein